MRRKLIQLHLYVAAFFLPMLVAMAVSGGLYLTGNKGSTARTPIEITAPQALSVSSQTLEADCRVVVVPAHGREHGGGEQPDEAARGDADGEREEATQDAKVAEAVAATGEHHEVGLVANGRGEGARGAEHEGEERLRRVEARHVQ